MSEVVDTFLEPLYKPSLHIVKVYDFLVHATDAPALHVATVDSLTEAAVLIAANGYHAIKKETP